MDTIRKNKVKLVIKSYNVGKAFREIAQIAHVSFREIIRIIRKYNGEKESEGTSNLSKAYGMFLAGKPVIIVMIHLGLGHEEVNQYYHEYLYLNIIDILVKSLKIIGTFRFF
jgi:hypothetical protein